MSTVEFSPNVQWYYGAAVPPEDIPSDWHGVTHVKYLGDPSDLQVGFGGTADPRGVLTPGEVYELDRVRIHSYHTKIFLAGIDSKQGFNSVSFEAVTPE